MYCYCHVWQLVHIVASWAPSPAQVSVSLELRQHPRFPSSGSSCCKAPLQRWHLCLLAGASYCMSWAYLKNVRLGFQVLWTPVSASSTYTSDDLARDYPRMEPLHMETQGPRTVVYITKAGEESVKKKGELSAMVELSSQVVLDRFRAHQWGGVGKKALLVRRVGRVFTQLWCKLGCFTVQALLLMGAAAAQHDAAQLLSHQAVASIKTPLSPPATTSPHSHNITQPANQTPSPPCRPSSCGRGADHPLSCPYGGCDWAAEAAAAERGRCKRQGRGRLHRTAFCGRVQPAGLHGGGQG